MRKLGMIDFWSRDDYGINKDLYREMEIFRTRKYFHIIFDIISIVKLYALRLFALRWKSDKYNIVMNMMLSLKF